MFSENQVELIRKYSKYPISIEEIANLVGCELFELENELQNPESEAAKAHSSGKAEHTITVYENTLDPYKKTQMQRNEQYETVKKLQKELFDID